MIKQVNPFYKSKKWKRKRENVLKRDNYLCRECSRYGKTTPATTVHHIFPLEWYPLLKLANINLLSLCNTCHGQMHDQFTGEITDKGLKWQGKISPHLDN